MRGLVARGWARPPLAMAVAVVLPMALLVISVQLGLSDLGSRRISAPGSAFDTTTAQSRPIGAITPLSASYLTHLLGPAAASAGGRRAAPAPQPASADTGVGDQPDSASAAPPVSLAARSNDDFDRAFPVSTMPFTAATDTTGATRESSEPSSCSAVVGTVWFRLRLPVSVPITVSTFGSSYQAITGVYAESDGGGLQQAACLRTIGDFTARAGTTYFFQVAGTGGSLLFHLVEAQRASHLLLGSVANDGHQPMSGNDGDTISADGRYLVGNSGDESLAGGAADETSTVLADLGVVPNQTCSTVGKPHLDYAPDEPTHTDVRPDCQVIYERDLQTGHNVMVDYGYQPVVSANGRYVAYTRSNAQSDEQVFEFDLRTHHRWLVSHGLGTPHMEGTASGMQHAMAWHPVMTPDGRYVAFASSASNLVPHDNNNTVDGFVWDRVTRKIRRITTSSTGREQDYGGAPNMAEIGVVQCLSPNGRYAVFSSPASNLGGVDTNNVSDVFRKDLRTGRLIRISVGLDGQADGSSPAPGHLNGHCISRSGRYVLFPSYADNLVPGDTNRSLDFFVRDVVRGTTVRVNVSSTGRQAVDDYGQCLYGLNDATPKKISCSQTDFACSITPSGRYVGFTSIASNLVADDTNGFADVFRHDMLSGETVRVSSALPNAVSQADDLAEQTEGGDSTGGDLSADGRAVAFHSFAANLVVGDADGVSDAFVARFPQLRLPLRDVLRPAPRGSVGERPMVAPRESRATQQKGADGGRTDAGPKSVAEVQSVFSDPLNVFGLTFRAADTRSPGSGGSGTDPFLVLLVAVPVGVVVTVWTAARRRPAFTTTGGR